MLAGPAVRCYFLNGSIPGQVPDFLGLDTSLSSSPTTGIPVAVDTIAFISGLLSVVRPIS
jgi:hypothetical protein